MKKWKYFLTIIAFCLLISSVYGDEINQLIYQYENPEVTVIFPAPIDIPVDRQQKIADELAGVSAPTIIDPNVASPDNIICTLFGHDLAPEVSVTVTHHKVRQYNPRCLMEVYHVTYCTRCNYTVEELDNSFYIFCCSED